jgi:hypothetical protein
VTQTYRLKKEKSWVNIQQDGTKTSFFAPPGSMLQLQELQGLDETRRARQKTWLQTPGPAMHVFHGKEPRNQLQIDHRN